MNKGTSFFKIPLRAENPGMGAVAQGHLDNLQRHLDKLPPLLSSTTPAVAALTSAVLRGPSAPARPSALRAHDAALAAAHQQLQGALGQVLAWHAGLLDACASLQAALDGRAGAGAQPLQRAAERCRELLCELQGDFGAECAVRAAVASSLLPLRCHALLPGGAGARAGAGTGEGAAPPPPYALPVAEESDREALTLCVAAWAVPAHTSAARCARVTGALRELLLQREAD